MSTDMATDMDTNMATDAEILSKIVDGITNLRRDVKHLIKRMNHKRKPSADTPKDEAHIDTTQDANDSPPETPSIEHPRPRLNRTHIFNRSKFLDIEDHDRLIQYVTSKAVIDAVSNAEPHKRVSLLCRLMHDNLKLSISIYMTQKLINTNMPINAARIAVSPSLPDPDVEIDSID